MSTQLDQIAKKAKSNPKLRFTSLAHLLTPDFLTETWKQMNRRGASGVDGETTKEFEQGLDTRVQELCERLKRGAYRAPPVRRVEIPKGPGKAGTRPLGIPTVEDRLLQRAVARILEAVFEADFLECSYGFRPGCNPHGALRALRGIIVTKKVGHLFEADIRGYFNHIRMAAEDGGSSDCRSVHPAPDRQMAKRRFHGGRSCYANGRRIATRRANQPDLIQYLPALRSGSLVREEDQTGVSGRGVPDEVC